MKKNLILSAILCSVMGISMASSQVAEVSPDDKDKGTNQEQTLKDISQKPDTSSNRADKVEKVMKVLWRQPGERYRNGVEVPGEGVNGSKVVATVIVVGVETAGKLAKGIKVLGTWLLSEDPNPDTLKIK